MPITGPIPLPGTGMEGFMQGRRENQNIVNSQVANQTNLGHLDIAKQAESRAQTMLPYLLQQYKDTHGKAASEAHMQGMYDTLTEFELKKAMPQLFGAPQQGQSAGQGSPAAPMPSPQVSQAPSAPQDSSQQAPPQVSQLPEEHRQKLVQALNDPNISPDEKQKIAQFLQSNPSPAQDQLVDKNQQQQQPQGQEGQQEPQQNAQQPSPPPQAAPPVQQTSEQEVTPASPGMEYKDALAKIGNKKFGEIKSKIDPKTGLIIKEYPSGRVTYQKINIPGIETPLSKALGKENAKIIGALDTATMGAYQTRDTLSEIGKIITNPEWDNMRQNPVLGKHELSWYAKFGTPAQQRLVGNFKASSGQIVSEMAQHFKGQFRKGEQALIEGMKTNDADTAQMAKGKIEALMTMNEMMIKRNTIESDLMRQGVSAPEAARQADQKVSSALVRKMVQQRLGIDKDVEKEKTAATSKHVVYNQTTGEFEAK